MSLRGIFLVMSQVVSGASIFWMRDASGDISIMARVFESQVKNASYMSSTRLAEKAQNMAVQEASRVGTVLYSSVYMGGNGDGKVSATGVAVLSWSPDVEKKLSMNGLQQVV